MPPPPEAAPGPVARAPRTVGPAPAASGRPSAEPSWQECPEGGVRLVEADGDAAMGLRVEGYRLVNCGTGDYVLEGFPEVRLLDKERRPVEVSVGHGSAPVTSEVPAVDAPARRVELKPGQAASMALVWRNRVTDVTVPAVEGWVLEVTPKPGAPRLVLPLTRPVDLGNTGQLGIGPWREQSREPSRP
ncbi:DUF4232 domain-containing protein [Streptomyces xanthophaeus]|uniref:DUF4232 domain-containing protein n=1 Tax=Streptomyces xanthophaeus TaxID=67385 RepID=UPI003864B8BA|nr:DUF4232 domain-containing protein [Streptomyces xanthophaeus]WST62538.1 DUF4232 domain-containing protein [Streptomyces xanthophaeus]